MRPISVSPKDIERFWSKVDRSGGPDACWPWLAYRNEKGYGYLGVGHFMVKSSRVAWVIANERDPGEMIIRHRCDNPPCCNPAHLVDGTVEDNIRDMFERDRFARGERNGVAKLNPDLVREIRRASAAGETYTEIGRRLGVSRTTARNAASRKQWVHVSDDPDSDE